MTKLKIGDKVKIKKQVGNYTYIIFHIGEEIAAVHLENKDCLKPVKITRLVKIND